jgi:hypothetical protein
MYVALGAQKVVRNAILCLIFTMFYHCFFSKIRNHCNMCFKLCAVLSFNGENFIEKILKGRGDEEIVEHVCRPYANAPDQPVLRPAELAANAIKGSVLHRCTLSPV